MSNTDRADKEAKLKLFINQLLLTVGQSDISVGGVRSTATEMAFALRQDVGSLARLISQKQRDEAKIKARASDIEGNIQTLQVLGHITNEYCTKLIDELQDNTMMKNDKYSQARGGWSRILNISCEYGHHVCYYQKDGPGPLKRMYIDRKIGIKPTGKLLTCLDCDHELGIKITYAKENRPAYRLF